MKKLISIVLVALLAIGFAGCAPQETVEETTTTVSTTEKVEQSTEQSSAPEIEEGNLIGQLAYDFELKDLDGNLIKLSDYRGKTVVLNFFATWCGPCQVETPHLNEVYLDLQDQDVAVLSVNLTASRNDEAEAVVEFANSYDVAFPIVLDEESKVAEKYRIRSIPTNYFINPNGVIHQVFSGALNKERFIELIEEAKTGE